MGFAAAKNYRIVAQTAHFDGHIARKLERDLLQFCSASEEHTLIHGNEHFAGPSDPVAEYLLNILQLRNLPHPEILENSQVLKRRAAERLAKKEKEERLHREAELKQGQIKANETKIRREKQRQQEERDRKDALAEKMKPFAEKHPVLHNILMFFVIMSAIKAFLLLLRYAS